MDNSSEILRAVYNLSSAMADLSGALNRGFMGLEGRIDRLEVRVTSLESEMRAGFARVDERFSRVDERLASIESRRRRRPS